MDPLRLQLILTLTARNAHLSPALSAQCIAQARRQLAARWPLAGCVIAGSVSAPAIISVGRQ